MTEPAVEEKPKRRYRRRGARSRRKGKVGELQLVRLLLDHNFEARRSQQYKGGEHSEDVHCPELAALGLHIECKRTESSRIDKWIAQAERDAGGEKLPLVFWRRNQRPFLAIMIAADFLALLRHLIDGGHTVSEEEEAPL